MSSDSSINPPIRPPLGKVPPLTNESEKPIRKQVKWRV